ncbi:hypothetical protein OROHE_003793 [Orobanche hederae]
MQAKQREEDAQLTKMILRDHEEKFKRLELLGAGVVYTDKYLLDENQSLKEENELLRARFQNCFEPRVQELLLSEVSELRNKLLEAQESNTQFKFLSRRDEQDNNVDKVLEGCRDLNTKLVRIEFFGQLYNMIRCHHSSFNVRCIRFAKVPLIRFRMYEVEVDVAYAQLKSLQVPKEEEWGKILEDGKFYDSIDKESLLALESIAVNYIISKSVPVENGEQAVSFFFGLFSVWNWEDPIALTGGHVKDSVVQKIRIQKPRTSECFCSTVNELTFTRILAELKRGADISEDLSSWRCLFLQYPFEEKDKDRRFLKIHLSVTECTELEEWVDNAKSKFILLLNLLRDLAAMSCDPNLAEFAESSQNPTRRFNRVFLWEIIEESHCHFYYLRKAEETWRKSLWGKNKGFIGTIKLDVVPNTIYRSYIVYSIHRR